MLKIKFLFAALFLLGISTVSGQNYIINPDTDGGFEGTHGWTILNTSNVNKWIVGSEEKTAGTSGAYVSNNNRTNVITNPQDSNSKIYIYKDVVVPLNATSISISFKYKNAGNDTPKPRCLFELTSACPALPTNGASSLVGSEFATFLSNATNWTTYTNNSPLNSDRVTYTSGDLIPGESYRIVFEWSAANQTSFIQTSPITKYPTGGRIQSSSPTYTPGGYLDQTLITNGDGNNFGIEWSVNNGAQIVSGQGTPNMRMFIPLGTTGIVNTYLRYTYPTPTFASSGKNSGPLAIDEVSMTFIATPKISAIAPLSGAVGSSVTITGEFFGASAVNNVVYLGGVKCPITAATSTSITVTVPQSATLNNFSVLNTTTNLSCFSNAKFVPTNLALSGISYNSNALTSFEAPVTFATGTFASSYDQKFVLADVDLDGKADIFSYSSAGLPQILRNTATAGIVDTSTFASNLSITNVSPSTPTAKNVLTTDLNNDGKLDFATNFNSLTNGGFANINSSVSGTSSLLMANNLLSTTNQYQVNASFLPIDINLDGRTDILGLNGTNASQALLYFTKNTSVGTTFSSITGNTFNLNSYNQKLNDTNFYSGASGDLDDDGKSDVVLSGTGKVYVLKNMTVQGNPQVRSFNFSEPMSKSISSGIAYTVKLVDLDLDGKLDVIASNSTSGIVSVYRNNSASSLSIANAQHIAVTGFSGTFGLAFADMNGDGRPDIVVSDNATKIAYLENTSVSGTISFAPSIIIVSTAAAYTQLELADIDGDAKPDIIVANASNGIVIFRNRAAEAGKITADQTICSGSTPAALTSLNPATFPAAGAITYKWQNSSDGTTWTDIVNTNSLGYTLPALTATTYYRRAAALSAAPTGFYFSNPISIKITSNPTISATTSNIICGTGIVPISAETSIGAGSFVNWYDALTGGNLVGRTISGANFNTPSITTNTIFYAQAEDAYGCLSLTRTAVNANLNLAIPVVTIGSFVTTKCDAGSFKLSASTSDEAVIKWYDAATGGNLVQTGNNFVTPILTADTTYYAEASNCNGASTRVAVALTLVSTPTIIAAPSISVCYGTPSITLTATISAGTANWYTTSTGGTAASANATISNITASTTRYVSAYVTTNGVTCESPRYQVAVNVVALPVITGSNQTVYGASSSVISVSNLANTSVNWYADAFGTQLLYSGSNSFTTPIINQTTVFYAVATDLSTGCTSIPKAIMVTYLGPLYDPLPNSFAITNQENMMVKATGLSRYSSYVWQRSDNGGVSWTSITASNASTLDAGIAYQGYTGTSGTTATLTLSKADPKMHGFQYRLVITGTSSGQTISTNSSLLNIADVYGECSTGEIPIVAMTNSILKTGLTTLSGTAFTSNAAHLSDGDTKTGVVALNNLTNEVSSGSLIFSGYDRISVPSSTQLDFSGTNANFTLESWIKINPNSFSINTIIGKKTPNQNTPGYAFYINSWDTSDRKLVLETAGGGIVSTSTIADNTWYHVAVSVINGYAKFYINGIADAGAGGAVGPTANSGQIMNVGQFGNNYGYFPMNGGLTDVRVWNVGRTAAEILANKNLDVSGQPNLVLNYKLNSTLGTTAIDNGPYGLNGTLNNTPNWSTDKPVTGTTKFSEIVTDLGGLYTVKGIRLANFSGLKDGATTVYPNFTGGYLESSSNGSSWVKRINSIPNLDINGATLALNDINARYFRLRKEDQTNNAFYGISEFSLLGGGYETVPYIRRALPASKFVLTGTTLDLSAVANAISGATITSYQWSSSTTPVDGTFTNLTNGGAISGATTTNLIISNYTNGTPTYYRLTATQSNGCIVNTQVLVNLETTPYYPTTTGTSTLNNLSSWTVNQNGVAGSTPTAFANGKYFYLKNSSGGTYQINSNWTNAGTLKLNGNSLSLTSTFNATLSSIEDFNASAFIKTLGTGYLKSVVSNVEKVFPVGNTTYSPVTITNNLGADEEFSVAVSNTVSNPESVNYVNKTWQISKTNIITSGGTHLDVTFEWDSSDTIGTISEPMIYYATTSNPTSWATLTASNYASIERSQNKITFKGLKGIIGNTVTYFIARNTTPTISSISPNATGANNQVIISGSGFIGATEVTLGSTAVSSFTVDSSSQITAVVGSGTTGNVAITTPGGGATLSNGFTFIPAPTITSFTPTKTNNGATITINGTNFTGATIVSIGGVSAASYSVVSATQITAVLPRNTISGSVSVTTRGGTAISPGFVYGVPAGTVPTFVVMPTINSNLSEIVRVISPPISNSTGVFTYSLPTNTVASVSGNLLQFNGVGTTTLTVNQASTSDYIAGSTTAVVNVFALPSIVFSNLNKTIGDVTSTLSATSNSVGTISYSSNNSSVATVSGSTLTIVGEGVAELSASQVANGFYTTAVEKAILVVKNTTKQTPTISWVSPIYKNTDSSNFILARPSSNSTGSFVFYSSNSNVAAIVGNTVTIVGEGTAVITAVQSATTVFNTAQITTQLIVQSSSKTNPTLINFASYTKLITDGTFTITAPTSNNTAPFKYIISNPDIAKINGSTITLVGLGVTKIIATQQASGIYNAGTIEATLIVNLPALPVINYTDPSNFRKNTAITTVSGSSTGGPISSYSISPNLPLGTSFNTATGVITGTPTMVSERKPYTVTAKNISGEGTSTVQLAVVDIAPSGLSYTTPNTFSVGTPISALDPTNNGSPITIFTVSPQLPAGLILNASTGTISGTPSTAVANTTYTITGTNSGGNTTTTIAITVTDAAPTDLDYSSPIVLFKGVVLTPITPSNSGGAITSYSILPALPAGISINSTTGAITGRPTIATSSIDYTITGTNSGGTVTKTISILVNDNEPTDLSYSTPNIFGVNVAIAPLTPTVYGGVVTNYTIEPTLPIGLSFDTTTGIISGTPTQITANATYTVTAINFMGRTSATIDIIIGGPATNLNYGGDMSLARNAVMNPIIPTLISTTSATYTVSPSLPVGLLLNTATGQISGTPTAVQSGQTYTVTANNGFTPYSTDTFSIEVVDRPTISYISPSNYTAGVAISNLIPIVTGLTPMTFTSSPTLPIGLTLDSTTGVISGTPTAYTPTAIYTITAVNSVGSGSNTVSITVNKLIPVLGVFNNISKTYGDVDFDITNPTTNSSGSFSYVSSNTSVATISGETVTILGVGSATITATLAADNDYNTATTTAEITVSKATPAFGAFVAINKTFGDSDFSLTAPTSNSTGALSYTSSDSNVVTISGNTVTLVGAGIAIITATQATDSNYLVGNSTTTITVDKAPVTLTTMSPITKTFGDADFDLVAPTSGATGAVIFDSSNTAVATINGNTITIVGAGTTIITATQAADANYLLATTNTTLLVNKLTPLLSNFNSISKTTDDLPFSLIAPLTSGGTGTITYSSSNTAVATILNNVVTIIGTGSATINATKTADSNYNTQTISTQLTVGVGTTQAPILSSPITNSVIPNLLQISYSLPEIPLVGSVRLIFTPVLGGLPIVWNMNNAAEATFSYVIGTSPTNISNVTSGNGLDFSKYNITISYQDLFGSPAVSDTNTNIELVSPPNISFANTNYSTVKNQLIVSVIPINTGSQVVRYSISPTLPAGLTFSSITGQIAGTPTVSQGTTSFTISAFNIAGQSNVTIAIFIDEDTDADGIGNATDSDIDNDGIPNSSDSDPDGDGIISNGNDTDNDGTNDANDSDIDGDGIINNSDSDINGDGTIDNGPDTDVDGINDTNDSDLDGDGIPNTNDSDINGDGTLDNGPDTDNDGTNDANDFDVDGDGIPNTSDSDINGDGTLDNGLDTDGDGINDTNDSDLDGDGIPNTNDSDINGDGTLDNGTDNDNDGINDANDSDIDGDGIPNTSDSDVDGDGVLDNGTDLDSDGINDVNDTDLDGDGITNNSDSDIDGDGVLDNGTDLDLDGINDVNDSDLDGDGIPNTSDADPNNDGNLDNGPDTDGDGINDTNDSDLDGDGISNTSDADPNNDGTLDNGPDNDGDGINDVNDVDVDGDGIPNTSDADSNNDGTIDNGPDTDNDGTNDANDFDVDGDGIPNTSDSDINGDGTIDNGTDIDSDGLNDTNDSDIDGDGIQNTNDSDVDGDGAIDNGTDIDSDGLNDTNDSDIDGDGVPNISDSDVNGDGTIDNGTDTDGDGINDANDTDIDGDGVPNVQEIIDGTNPIIPGAQDTDGDGVPDYVEQQQGTNPNIPGAKDTDTDGIPDYIELQENTNPNNASNFKDVDADRLSNYEEGYNYLNPTTSIDTDLDGTPDYLDLDSDGDGILDRNDAFPLNRAEWTDTDRDGTGNNADTDDDNDGILDGCDADVNGDSIPDNGIDMDSDGIMDSCDTDRDGDGVNNTSDNCPDMSNVNQADRDSDGKGDVCDTIELNVVEAITPNGDGVNDTWVIYNLENHPSSTVRVFNANGMQVFYSANYQNDWAGKYQGSSEMLPVGSYLYQIDLGGDGTIDAQGWIYITK